MAELTCVLSRMLPQSDLGGKHQITYVASKHLISVRLLVVLQMGLSDELPAALSAFEWLRYVFVTIEMILLIVSAFEAFFAYCASVFDHFSAIVLPDCDVDGTFHLSCRRCVRSGMC